MLEISPEMSGVIESGWAAAESLSEEAVTAKSSKLAAYVMPVSPNSMAAKISLFMV